MRLPVDVPRAGAMSDEYSIRIREDAETFAISSRVTVHDSDLGQFLTGDLLAKTSTLWLARSSDPIAVLTRTVMFQGQTFVASLTAQGCANVGTEGCRTGSAQQKGSLRNADYDSSDSGPDFTRCGVQTVSHHFTASLSAWARWNAARAFS